MNKRSANYQNGAEWVLGHGQGLLTGERLKFSDESSALEYII